jgi:hypothetical protein
MFTSESGITSMGPRENNESLHDWMSCLLDDGGGGAGAGASARADVIVADIASNALADDTGTVADEILFSVAIIFAGTSGKFNGRSPDLILVFLTLVFLTFVFLTFVFLTLVLSVGVGLIRLAAGARNSQTNSASESPSSHSIEPAKRAWLVRLRLRLDLDLHLLGEEAWLDLDLDLDLDLHLLGEEAWLDLDLHLLGEMDLDLIELDLLGELIVLVGSFVAAKGDADIKSANTESLTGADISDITLSLFC